MDENVVNHWNPTINGLKPVKEHVSEDAVKNAEIDVQELTNKYIEKIEEMLNRKEEDIMTV